MSEIPSQQEVDEYDFIYIASTNLEQAMLSVKEQINARISAGWQPYGQPVIVGFPQHSPTDPYWCAVIQPMQHNLPGTEVIQ